MAGRACAPPASFPRFLELEAFGVCDMALKDVFPAGRSTAKNLGEREQKRDVNVFYRYTRSERLTDEKIVVAFALGSCVMARAALAMT